MTENVVPQTVVLTGGTAGLGYACARAIAESHPARHLIIASRNQQQATVVVETLRRETGNQHIEWMLLDLASLESVRSFARDFAERELPPLHAVVCNAGLQESYDQQKAAQIWEGSAELVKLQPTETILFSEKGSVS
jgi:NAD(P)-dependent dehydrogenase (short-subunit alcohol dehydrogenase family)